MFKPNEPVLYRQGEKWMAATIVRIAFPVTRDGEGELPAGVEATALIRLGDGREMSVPLTHLRQAN